MPTATEFASSLADLLLRTQGAIDRPALLTFVRGLWPAVADDPDVRRWAGEYRAGTAA